MRFAVFILVLLTILVVFWNHKTATFVLPRKFKFNKSNDDSNRFPQPVEEQKAIREIVHRVKNHMQLINSIISLQIRSYQGEEATVFLKKCQKRIYTIMVIYQQDHEEFVNDAIRVTQYVQELTDYLKTLFQDKLSYSVHFNFEIQIPYMSSEVCTPMGVILNEFLCNSLQHAQPKGQELMIHLTIKESVDGKISIDFYDTGILEQIPKSRKLGLELAYLMVEQLKGCLEVKINAFSNLSYHIQFPNIKTN